MTKSHQAAHEANLDAAQRELDRRAAEGEDVSHLRVNPKTYAIEPVLQKPTAFQIHGEPAVGTQAELHFQEWCLSVEREGQPVPRTALDANATFQRGVYGNDTEARDLVIRSGVGLLLPLPTIRLIARHGCLWFPQGGGFDESPDEPSMLMKTYAAGDMDSIPWPELVTADEPLRRTLRERLARALYDERECNPFFANEARIELPDGTPFDFPI